MTVTTNQLYSAIQDFKHYVQDNFPFKLTSYSGELDPSVTGFIANVPSIYFQVSNTGTVIKTFIKTEQSVNTAWAELGAGGGSLSPWEYKNTNFAAVDGGRYVVDTSVLPLTLTLPDNPTDGFSISVIDAAYSFELNNLSLVSATGTYTIESETLPIILDIDGISIDLIFVEATNNFRLVVNQGKAGQGGATLQPWQYQTSDFSVIDGGRYLINSETLPITVTLPDTPTDGFSISIIDATKSFDTNNVTFQSVSGTFTIENNAQPFIADVNGIAFDLVFSETLNNFIVVVNQGAAGQDGGGGGGGIQSVQEGENVVVDDTDPLNPIVSSPLKYFELDDTNSPQEVENNTTYLVKIPSGGVTYVALDLPVNPPDHFTFTVVDITGEFDNGGLTINNPSTALFLGTNDTVNSIDVEYLSVTFVYLESTNSYEVINSSVNPFFLYSPA